MNKYFFVHYPNIQCTVTEWRLTLTSTHSPTQSLTYSLCIIKFLLGPVRIRDKQNRNGNAKKVYQKSPIGKQHIPWHIPNFLFLRRGGSDPKSVYVEFVMNKEALELGFFPSTSVLPRPCLSKIHTHISNIFCRCLIILASDSVVK